MSVAGDMRARIRRALDERGMTLDGLAEASGLHRATVYRTMSEASKHSPRADTLDRLLSAALSVSPSVAERDPEGAPRGCVSPKAAPRVREEGAALTIKNGRVTLNLQTEVSYAVAQQILSMIEGDQK